MLSYWGIKQMFSRIEVDDIGSKVRMTVMVTLENDDLTDFYE